MWPSCGASGCMNNAKVQNIRKQKQTKARCLAPFLSRDRNHFFDQYIVLQRRIVKKNANVNLIGHQSLSPGTNAFLPFARSGCEPVLGVRASVWTRVRDANSPTWQGGDLCGSGQEMKAAPWRSRARPSQRGWARSRFHCTACPPQTASAHLVHF